MTHIKTAASSRTKTASSSSPSTSKSHKYRVFTNDVSPNGYSCLGEFSSGSLWKVLIDATKRLSETNDWRLKFLVMPSYRALRAFKAGSGRKPGGLKCKPGTFKKFGVRV